MPTERRRDYQRNPDAAPQRGSIEDSFASLLASEVTPDTLYETVCSLQIELVLTAHPTEVVRRTLRRVQRSIAELLELRDRPAVTQWEREEVLQALRRAITAAWTTDEIRRRRPTPLDEVEWGLVVFEQTLWDAVPRYMRALDRALRSATGKALPLHATPIRFGSWMGGDRDGNPNVTPEVTEKACLLARWIAADLYGKELSSLRSELSMRDGSAELRARVGNVHEPYRVLLQEVYERLLYTRECIEGALEGRQPVGDADTRMYWDPHDLAEPLHLCLRSLRETGAGVMTEGRLLDLLRRVACFGLTLVQLDIRQEAARRAQHRARAPAVAPPTLRRRHSQSGDKSPSGLPVSPSSSSVLVASRRINLLCNALNAHRVPRLATDIPPAVADGSWPARTRTLV